MAQHLRRLVAREHQQAAVRLGSDRVQPERELGDDAEVAAAAAQTPQQVRVLGLARGDHGRRKR